MGKCGGRGQGSGKSLPPDVPWVPKRLREHDEQMQVWGGDGDQGQGSGKSVRRCGGGGGERRRSCS